MSPTPDALPPGLDELLKALRAAGLPVGTREILRLHRVFSLEPALAQTGEPDDQLRRLLRAALVHSPGERAIFDPVFREWSGRWQRWETEGQREEAPAVPRKRKTAGSPQVCTWRPSLIAAIGLVALVAGAVALWHYLSADAPRPPPPVQPLPPPEIVEYDVTEDDDFRLVSRDPPLDSLPMWVPEIVVEPASGAADLSAFYLGLVFLISASLLTLRGFKQRKPPPRRFSEPSLPGPKRLPYLPLPDTGPELLDAHGARTLVWGVGRHQAEQLTTEIDLERTADATARRGGMPELRHVPEKRLREVWLWVDGTVDDPALERYAEEIAASLEQNGLTVRIGAFDGYPEELVWDEGQRFRPAELEGHRQTALVAVMTDGALLVHHARTTRRKSVATLLRALAPWERLAFVDFSQSRDLAAEVGRYGIACVEPEALPDFFGLGVARVPGHQPVDSAMLHAWAAALALAPRAVERRDAYALRRELGLEISPWHLGWLAPAGAFGVHLDLEAQRVAELRWLRNAEEDGGILARALGFWERRLAQEDERRLERGELESWADRPARRYLAMERALLELWHDPEKACAKLDELAALDERLAEEIRRRLKVCGDAAAKGEDRIPLPWRLGALPGPVRQRLGELGLDVGRGHVRPPGRLALATGILFGLGAVLLGQGLRPEPRPAQLPPPEIHCDVPSEPEHAFCMDSIDGWVYAGTPHASGDELTALRLAPGDEARVTWERQEAPCVVNRGTAQIWRCPRETTIRLALPWPSRRLAVLEFPADDSAATSFARTLLDSGSVDALLLGEDARRYLADLTGPSGRWQQEEELLWLVTEGETIPELGNRFEGKSVVVEVRDVAGLEERLRLLTRATPVADMSDDVASVSGGDGSLLLHYCPALEGEHVPSGMRFVWVCGGQLRMGSEQDDQAAGSDERPAHEVELSGFWIGEKEVSNAEYRSWQRDHRGEDEMPSANVDWSQARELCQSLGRSDDWKYDLPSEAQWEYAARGNTGRRYPWGDEQPTEDLAVFESGSPKPVGSLPQGAGPFGTLDQAGNVWEWVLDCYDPDVYEERERAGEVVEDPVIVDEARCETYSMPSALRVLRGGSFRGGPWGLRAAGRFGFQPEYRRGLIGFRCVRRPRRRP